MIEDPGASREPNASAMRLLCMQQAAPTSKVVRGHLEAEFSDLYLRSYRQMVTLALATTQSLAIAEEVAQDAFIDLYRHWESVSARDAWLRRAVATRSTSWLRRHLLERRVTHERPTIQQTTSIVELRLMLSQLSTRQRMAVILRFYEDMSENDMAFVLKCRPGTVKSLLNRALRRLEVELSRANTA